MARPWQRRARLVALLAVVLSGTASVEAPVELAIDALAFRGHDRVMELDAYGPAGTIAVGYADGAGALVELALRNQGHRSVTVTGIDPFPELLGMLEVQGLAGLPVTLPPGASATVVVRARFGNCAYYTERAVNHFLHAEVEVQRLGRQRVAAVPYPREVVLRSPTILGCPDRVTDRGARQRLLARDE